MFAVAINGYSDLLVQSYEGPPYIGLAHDDLLLFALDGSSLTS